MIQAEMSLWTARFQVVRAIDIFASSWKVGILERFLFKGAISEYYKICNTLDYPLELIDTSACSNHTDSSIENAWDKTS